MSDKIDVTKINARIEYDKKTLEWYEQTINELIRNGKELTCQENHLLLVDVPYIFNDLIEQLQQKEQELLQNMQQLEQSKAECEELKAEINEYHILAKETISTQKMVIEAIDKLKAENQKCKEALEFYADEENYDDSVAGDMCETWIGAEIMTDRGKRATQALKEIGDKK